MHIEILVSVLLIAVAMGSIVTSYIRSSAVLRASREVAAASQVLQQRIEMIRNRSWSEISNSETLAQLLSAPADSETELSDSHLTETITVTVPTSVSTANGLAETEESFAIRRVKRSVTVEEPGDFLLEPTLLIEGSVTWRDRIGVHQHILRTVVCRSGLTRSGIVGTVLGRPGARVSVKR